jgi:hypothetical protein
MFDNEQFVPVEYTGEWQWVQSSGGFIGEVIEAESVDYTQSLHINQNNEARWFRDGELVQKFEISELNDDEDGELLLKPDLDGSENSSPIEKVILGFEDGFLTVFDRCADCYSYLFSR